MFDHHARNPHRLLLVTIATGGLASPAAMAQSYNIDFGADGAAPSAAYAAAGLPGVWNSLGVPTPGVHYPLMNLQGQSTGVTLNNLGGTQLLSFDDRATAGDHGQLMDDMLISFNNPVDACIWIRNLPNGPYEVLIYAMTPGDSSLMSRTRVDETGEPPIMVGGAWPGAHQHGVTYSRFTAQVTNNIIGLHSGLFGGLIQSGINGIQVRPLITGDLNGDALVNGLDIAILLGQWTGAATYAACPPHAIADLNQDCRINGLDLAILLGAWAP